MSTKTESLTSPQLLQADEVDAALPSEEGAVKRPFVEPQVSFPIDVLEATTFFQLTDSGVVA